MMRCPSMMLLTTLLVLCSSGTGAAADTASGTLDGSGAPVVTTDSAVTAASPPSEAISQAAPTKAQGRGATILSLDETRTGNANIAGLADVYLGSTSMTDATQMLVDAGATVQTANLFTAANIAGADVLFTGLVDVAFTGQELVDVEAFVNAGGGLVILRDWGGFYPAADPLLAVFGVTYDTGAHGVGGTPTAVNLSAAHEIWSGPAGSTTSYLQVFSAAISSGATVIGTHSTDATGALGVLAHGAGRVVLLTDAAAWDTNASDPTTTPAVGNDNGIVWQNIFHWVTPVPLPAELTSLSVE